jgi:hypothetical protein
MPITTTKLSKNKTSRQCIKHRRLVTLTTQDTPITGRHHGQRFVPEDRSGPQPTANITNLEPVKNTNKRQQTAGKESKNKEPIKAGQTRIVCRWLPCKRFQGIGSHLRKN